MSEPLTDPLATRWPTSNVSSALTRLRRSRPCHPSGSPTWLPALNRQREAQRALADVAIENGLGFLPRVLRLGVRKALMG